MNRYFFCGLLIIFFYMYGGLAAQVRFQKKERYMMYSLTGLTWQEENTTDLFSDTYHQKKTFAYCNNFTPDNFSDLCLPTAKELSSLVNVKSYKSAVDPTLKPDFDWNCRTSVDAIEADNAWRTDGLFYGSNWYKRTNGFLMDCIYSEK